MKLYTDFWIFSCFDRNSPLPCNVILEGSRLGFDITPFAKQIMQLRGRRRQNPYLRLKSPINPSMRNILEILGQLPNGSNVFTPINPAAVLKVRRKGENMYWKKLLAWTISIINNLLWLEEYVSNVFLLLIQIRFKGKYYWRTWTESGLLNNFYAKNYKL